MIKKIIKLLPCDVRDFYIGLKRYSLKRSDKRSEQLLIAMVDGKSYHGGFCDRFKGIISLYHYCLLRNIKFKIAYSYPFNLEDYLSPNEYNWILEETDFCKSVFDAKFINLVGDPSAKRLIDLKTKKQIHCYANRDIITELNIKFNCNHDWGTLFNKLFEPTDNLKNLIETHTKLIGKSYISAVFRFQQLLGDFAEYNYAQLPENKKEDLICRNIEAIKMILKKSEEKTILITSDSQLFLERASYIDGVYPLLGKVVHIDCTTDASYDVYMKSFLDFFMLSKGKKIFSIGTKEMYKTEFPLYAAKINKIPFERILIDDSKYKF